jgi:hypothetical protein
LDLAGTDKGIAENYSAKGSASSTAALKKLHQHQLT